MRLRTNLTREDCTSVAIAVLSLVSAYLADQQQLWVDEKITVNLVTRWSPVELITVLPHHQPHLPTYYLFLDIVGFWAGSVASVVAFPVTVLATIQAGRELFTSRTRAQMAGYLVALSPFLATQAGWLRMYSLLTALLTVGVWQTLADNDRRAGACFLIGCLIHPFAIFPLGWYLGTVYRRRRSIPFDLRHVALGMGPLAALIVLKFLRGGPGFSGFSTGVTHGDLPSVLEIGILPVSALVGAHYTSGQALLAVLLTVAMLYPLPDTRILTYSVLPVAGVIGVSYLLHPVFQPKYFGFIAPAVALLLVHPRRSWVHRYVLGILTAGLLATMWVWRVYGFAVTRYYALLF